MSESNRITADEVAAVLNAIVEDPSFPGEGDPAALEEDPSGLALVRRLEVSEKPDQRLSELGGYVAHRLELIAPAVDRSPSVDVEQIIAELGSTSRIGPKAADALPRLIEIGRRAPFVSVDSGVSNVLMSSGATALVSALGSSTWPPR